MNIEYLNEFVFLADTLSFKRTADHFYVSRSVISRHMAALEEHLGTRLLDRDSRGVRLSQAGKVFYREAKIVLRAWEVALERVQSLHEDGKSLVRVGYLRNATRPFLVQFVNHLTQEHPQIRLSLMCMDYNGLRRALDEHAIDVALGMNVVPSLSRNYRSTMVYEDCFYAVCAPDHPLAAKSTRGVRVEDLRNQKLLLPDAYIYSGLARFVEEFVDEKTMLAAQSYYSDMDMLYLKVKTEGYVAFSSAMNNALFGRAVAVLPLLDCDSCFKVSAFYDNDFTGEAFAACEKTLEWCREHLKRQPFDSIQMFS